MIETAYPGIFWAILLTCILILIGIFIVWIKLDIFINKNNEL